MNFENISAENRSHQIYIPRARARAERCCSFCRGIGHNITNCNSDRLIEFEILCADTVRNIEILDDFKNWLLRNYIDNQLLIKAFAIKKFGVNSRYNMSYYVDLIAEYIFRTYKENTNQENTNLENTNININDDLESELIHFLGELRNPIQREYQEIQDVEGIENIVMNEFLTAMLFNDLITQIRQEYNAINAINATNAISLVVDNNIDNYENVDEICKCSICWDDKELNNFVKLGCNHEFCKDCIIKTLRSDQTNLHCCSLCRTEVKTIIAKTDAIKDELAEVIA